MGIKKKNNCKLHSETKETKLREVINEKCLDKINGTGAGWKKLMKGGKICLMKMTCT